MFFFLLLFVFFCTSFSVRKWKLQRNYKNESPRKASPWSSIRQVMETVFTTIKVINTFEFKGPLNAFVNLAIFLSLWRLYLWINLKFQEKRPSLLSELAAVNGARYFRGAKTPRIKLMRLSFFFFFPNKSGTFVKSSSLPSRRSFRHAIFPSIPWRGKGDCVTGQKRLPSRVTRTSRSRALGESLLSVFQGWYINFILFYFIFKFFF